MSALPQDKQFMTPEEYLTFERATEEKHEFFDGEVVLTPRGKHHHHNSITGNVLGHLFPQLRQTPYDVFVSQMRVKVSKIDFYTYPDVIVTSDQSEFEDSETDTLLNPKIIFEVFSTDTEGYDRGKKFQRYRELDSLQEYVLIAQDSLQIEHYLRQGEKWVLTDARGPDAVVTLPSIDCSLALSDMYAKVELAE